MSILEAIILGAIQGLTEFLPVSSSGHLVLVQELLGISQQGMSFEVVVHLGTLLSVIIYFRKRLLILATSVFNSDAKNERRMILFLAVGTIPSGLAGVLLKDYFEKAFSNPVLTSAMLIVTGLVLLSTRWALRGTNSIGFKQASLIGVAQAMAIMPGISRSGSTIAAGVWLGVPASVAAEYSFLLAIPVIGGAALLNMGELMAMPSSDLSTFGIAAITAFVFGILAVHLVLNLIRRGRFELFAYYCFAAGAVGLYLFL